MKIALLTTSSNTEAGPHTGQSMLQRQLEILGHTVERFKLIPAHSAIDHDARPTIYVVPHAVARPGDHTLTVGKDLLTWREFARTTDCDVAHITNPGALVDRVARRLDTDHLPMVLSIHDPHEFQYLGQGMRTLMTKARGLLFIGWRHLEETRAANVIPRQEFDRKARHTYQPYCRVAETAHHEPHQMTAVCTSPWRFNKNIPLAVAAAPLLEQAGIRLQFWTGNRNSMVAELAELTLGWELCEDHPDPWRWPEDGHALYAQAGTLLDLTYFDRTDTGRPEYPILEAWDFGITPVVLEAFAGPEDHTNELLDGRTVYTAPPTPEGVALAAGKAISTPIPRTELDGALAPHILAAVDFVDAYQEAIQGT